MLLYQVLADTIYVKTYRSHTKTINLKNPCKSGFKRFSYLCIILSIRYSRQFWLLKIIKKYEAVDDNLPVRIYVNKIEIITFKIKIGYYVELLSSETWNCLRALKVTYLKMNGTSFRNYWSSIGSL